MNPTSEESLNVIIECCHAPVSRVDIVDFAPWGSMRRSTRDDVILFVANSSSNNSRALAEIGCRQARVQDFQPDIGVVRRTRWDS
jgi:hypothetical protein